jgi:hypothetical protein
LVAVYIAHALSPKYCLADIQKEVRRATLAPRHDAALIIRRE